MNNTEEEYDIDELKRVRTYYEYISNDRNKYNKFDRDCAKVAVYALNTAINSFDLKV